MELLKMEDIGKAFFGVPALQNVSLIIQAGEVHALLGENGAGKSTLMNILGGVYEKDSGTVTFDGKELAGGSIKESEESGIAFVHQELNIFNDLRVYENLFLCNEIVGKFGKVKKSEMVARTRELMESLGTEIDPMAMGHELDAGKKQLLEIAKAVYADAKLLILDEPTTALNTESIEKLFAIVRKLTSSGKSVIFISHKMPEIFEIADRYTVLRNGCMVKTGAIADTNPEEITRSMVGESYDASDFYQERELGETVLEVQNLSGEGFTDVSFSVKKGEIVGLTGLQGAGCSEVMQTIFGSLKKTAGTVKVNGKELKRNTIHEAMINRVGMVAANRKENSILPDMTILENDYISEHTLKAFPFHISSKKEREKYEGFKKSLNIKAENCNNLITSLSGGNQQKVILARWMNTDAEILLFDNPTQGIDVGAKSEIYKLILELARGGKTILVNTLEIPEIKKIADRCIIFYHGTIKGDMSHEEIDEQTVMLYATDAYGTMGTKEAEAV